MSEPKVKSTYTPDKDAGPHLFGAVSIYLPGVLVIRDVPDEGQDVSFRVAWVDGEGLRPTAITVSSTMGKEVTSTDLRKVNVKHLWRAAIVDHVQYMRMFLFDWEQEEWDGKVAWESPLQLPDDTLERLRLMGPTRSTLSYVVDLYMFAETIGLAPALYVQEMFAGENLEPLPRTTATKWIKKARDTHLFDEWN